MCLGGYGAVNSYKFITVPVLFLVLMIYLFPKVYFKRGPVKWSELKDVDQKWYYGHILSGNKYLMKRIDMTDFNFQDL